MPTGPILRILDANANRAREALRMLEDYARFVLNHDPLSAALKNLRHDLAAATAPLLAAAILHRDTPGDVGTDNKTPDEFRRADLADLVTAAGKRLGEALRVIEECLKTDAPSSASIVESIRYRFYTLEQQLARTLHPADRFKNVRLYVLITESLCKLPWLQAAEQAILGGADCLQLREKNLDSGDLLRRAHQLVSLCRQHNVLCIINDRPDIALLADADGVHVGQTDLPAPDVRKLLGPHKLLGVSTHCIEQARQALLDGADYIGVGPVFPSSTKPRDILPGLPYARQVAQAIPLPAVAIAGITESNLDQVLSTGLRSIAVTASVIGTADPRAAAQRLKARLTSGLPPMTAPISSGADIPVCPPETPATPDLTKTRRRLPHWQLADATYFLTFRVASSELSPPERTELLQHIRSGHGKFYNLIATVIMPDHVHVLLQPHANMNLSRITKGIKGVSAHRINQLRRTTGSIWQDESWDRIIRDQHELDEKLEYMLNNPMKRDLVDDPWQYEWSFFNPECPV